MPRFHFHIRDDDGIIPDHDGMDCPDTTAALLEGEQSAREALIHDIQAHREVDHRRIEVTDEQGKVLGTFSLKNIVH